MSSTSPERRQPQRAPVQVGRHARSTGGGVRIAFNAPLNRAARAVLRRKGRLLITPHDGKPWRATRAVILPSPSPSPSPSASPSPAAAALAARHPGRR